MRKIKKTIILIIGLIFVVLGILGLVLPVLQGILFLAIGFLLVSFCFPQTRPWLDKHTEKYPKIHSALNKVETWMAKILGDIEEF